MAVEGSGTDEMALMVQCPTPPNTGWPASFKTMFSPEGTAQFWLKSISVSRVEPFPVMAEFPASGEALIVLIW